MNASHLISRSREWIARHRGAALILLLLAAFGVGFLVRAGWPARQPAADTAPPDERPHAGHAGVHDHVHDHDHHVHDHHDHDHHDHDHHHPDPHVHAPPMHSLRELTVSPAARALMNVEVSPVERRYVTAVVRMVGRVDFDETRRRFITAWTGGRLDRLFVDFTGIEVRVGDHVASIYSEELIVVQEELIRALRFERDRPARAEARPDRDLAESAREKLRRLGMTAEQIQELEQLERAPTHVTIHSPVSGTVTERLRKEGDRVATGDRLYAVADLGHAWVRMEAYESDLPWIRYGQEIEFTTEAYPGEVFPGRIAFIDPVLSKQTRTVSVRVNVPNPERKLKPEMFVRGVVRSQVAAGGRVVDPALAGMWICRMHPGVVQPDRGDCDVCGMELVPAETFGYVAPHPDELPPPVVIPVSAALVTGTRAVVYVEIPEAEQPTFEGREIVLGPRAGDWYLVKHGLREGELVVTRGNFKIDSAIQIQARPSMLSPEGAPSPGHDHGHDMEMAMPAPHEPVQIGPMPVPTPVAERMHALEMAAAETARAVGSEDLPRIRQAFREFGQALDAVEGERLTGHARMVWNELEMLLRNDAVEGEQVEQVRDARRVLESLRRDVRRIRTQFVVEGHTEEHAH